MGELPYRLVLALLLLCACAYAWSLVPERGSVLIRINYAYAPGYESEEPGIGETRVIPAARWALKSVAAPAAPPEP